ncbi:MAG: hypothetical protein R3D85_14930 [Paracoccaceae bacterium]
MSGNDVRPTVFPSKDLARCPFPRPAAARLTATAALILATGAAGATDFTDSVSVIDNLLCVGPDCGPSASEPAIVGAAGIKLKGNALTIRFEDTGPSPDSDRDWQITANNNAASENFYVRDVESSTTPFWIEGGAPSNALRIDPSGRIGIGTANPVTSIHVIEGGEPAVLLERDGRLGLSPYYWLIEGNEDTFNIRPDGDFTFSIRKGAPSGAFVLDDFGNLGLGLAVGGVPEASLHIKRTNGTASLLVEETNASTSPRTLLNLKNNGRPEIVMANTDTGGEWSFGAGTNFILKQGAVGSASSAKTKLFEISGSGNATLAGTLTTGGPSCASGCDAVFAADYALPSIADHAARMFALGHLPNVGPTAPGAPVNLSERYGRILNELEHAHIYIAQQEDRLTRQTARIARQEAQIASQAARLTRLEARLSASGG